MQRGQHVAQPEVGVEAAARRAERGQVEESERPEPVVDGDDDRRRRCRPTPGRRRAAGSPSQGCRRRRAPTPSPAWRPRPRCPTTPRCSGVRQSSPCGAPRSIGNPRLDRLRADRPELVCVGDLGPRPRRFGCPPAPLTGRRRGVPHALPRLDPAVVAAADRPVDGLDHRDRCLPSARYYRRVQNPCARHVIAKVVYLVHNL